jgi:PleD family two-component response regulator
MPDQGRPGSLAHRLSASTRILAVEDEADIAEFLRAYFRASGYDLIHLDPSTPEAVVDAIDEHKPDVVLLDYRLRGFSGHDAYRLIRERERFSFLPVIIVTGDVHARAKTRDTASGLDGFVNKPFNVNTLAQVVAERVDAARLLAEAGRDEVLGVMTQAYLTARLTDELNAAGPTHPVSFALVQVRTLAEIERAAGTQGVTYVARELIAIVREYLPDGAVLGRTDSNELAVMLSGTSAVTLEPMLAAALAATPGAIAMPGGATVKVELSAGLASYPEHAGSVDELYMAADAALADAMDAHSSLCVAI